MRVIPLYIVFGALLSCSKDVGYSLNFRKNSCIKEINKQYRDQTRAPSSIYKLNNIVEASKGPQLKVSVWHNYSWYYQGVKKYTYFKDTNLFAYKKINCPDNSDGPTGIADRIDMKL